MNNPYRVIFLEELEKARTKRPDCKELQEFDPNDDKQIQDLFEKAFGI